MWTVLEKTGIHKHLKKAPREVRVRYEAWKRIAEIQGPQGIRHIKGFRDKALKGRRRNQRASRLGKQWRVIYRMNKQEMLVLVLEVNPHTY
jgi:mRNA-degrading endonuclease RelE of RelBE toxin-antitoxin system